MSKKQIQNAIRWAGAAGSYVCEFEVTYSDSTIETFPNDGYIRVEVLSDIA